MARFPRVLISQWKSSLGSTIELYGYPPSKDYDLDTITGLWLLIKKNDEEAIEYVQNLIDRGVFDPKSKWVKVK